MQKIIRGLAALALVGTAATATAGELKLTIANGRATLIAQDVPARQILAEWARLGGTKIINGEKVVGPALTVQMIDRPEREVLDLVLRAASGYVAAPRAEAVANLSIYDRVVILASSVAPAYTPSATPTAFTRPPMPMPVGDDPVDHPNVPPQGMPAGPGMPPGMPPPMPPGGPNYGPQQAPGMPVAQPQAAPGMPTNQPLTSPRPGMLPAPPQPTTPPNPFAPPFRSPVNGRGGGPGNQPGGQ